ncbi:MAG: hypothetical protein H0V49_08395 [Nocardioidaceae bacterium]|nr:hypothetical protein [Nocardioidaceae bacterium]
MHEPTLLATDRETRRRRGLIVALLAAAVVGAGVGGWLLFASALGSLSAPSAASPAPAPEGTGTRPSAALEASATTRVRLTPDKGLAVSASYVFSEPAGQIWLTVPPESEGVGRDFTPAITHLQVSVPGRPQRKVSGQLVAGSRISVPIPVDATEVTFEYLVEGAVQRSIPSSRGRAVALLTPLNVTSRADIDNTGILEGSEVISVGCEINGSAMTACGSGSDQGWQVTIDSAMGDTRIVAGLDLAQP